VSGRANVWKRKREVGRDSEGKIGGGEEYEGREIVNSGKREVDTAGSWEDDEATLLGQVE